MTRDRHASVILLGLLALAYGVGVLPQIFFRHDDWWILGNSVRYLPGNWGFLFKPSLHHGDSEIVWFFRPGFKLIVYAFYHLFGLNYQVWMGTLLALFLGTIWLGFATVTRVTGHTRNGFWFVAAIAASFSVHFGSLAWAGEGMMNVPQVFLLMLCTYAFVRALGTAPAFWMAVSCLGFVLALGFKESSLFHTAFLAGMVCAEPSFHRQTWTKTLLPLAPFAVLGVGYLYFRLGAMPVNPSYLPSYTFQKVFRSGLVALTPLALPLALWGLVLRLQGRANLKNYLRGLASRAFYLPFVAVSLAIYLGHDFFSPGWLLVVGTFTALFLAFTPLSTSLESQVVWRFAVLLFLCSCGPVVLRLNSIGWWHWQQAQRGVFRSVASASDRTTRLIVRSCEHPSYPGVSFDRVVANAEGLKQMWYLTHGTDIKTELFLCSYEPSVGPGDLVMDWRFPEVGRVLASP